MNNLFITLCLSFSSSNSSLPLTPLVTPHQYFDYHYNSTCNLLSPLSVAGMYMYLGLTIWNWKRVPGENSLSSH